MFVPAFWSTILIANHAIIKYNVPREIVFISTSTINLREATDEDLDILASPRVKKNGDTFYLSNGFVSWINCGNVDFEDIELLWTDEIKMLKNHGLQFGRDMVRVQWFNKEFYTIDENKKNVSCEWVKFIGDNHMSDPVLLWIDANRLFKGYHIRGINT
jgi:dipeptidase